MAHRLSTLHDADDRKVFDKVVVITDRVVLDRQLQETIYQFEHARGVVVKIDEDSTQLAEALAGRAGADHHHDAAEVPVRARQDRRAAGPQLRGDRRRGALLADRRGGQGSAAGARRRRGAGADGRRGRGRRASSPTPIDPVEEALAQGRSARAAAGSRTCRSSRSPRRRRAGRWSCSARCNPETERYEPFHLYSMRQAIEEGFILDVLANYTTYQTFWKIEKAIERRPRVRRQEGAAGDRPVRDACTRTTWRRRPRSSSSTSAATPPAKIGGQAKAMVVTSSRLHAVRYKQAHRQVHRRARATPTSSALVAFSGKVDDGTASPLHRGRA